VRTVTLRVGTYSDAFAEHRRHRGLEKHGPPIGPPKSGDRLAPSIYTRIVTMTPFFPQPPTMTAIADSSLEQAILVIMFSKTVETSTYSPNGGVLII
jgi:hypothetical protein